jgi:hypothetical protein
MFDSVCVGDLRNGKEVEAPHAFGSMQVARQPEVMPVLCHQWTLGGVTFHYQSVVDRNRSLSGNAV